MTCWVRSSGASASVSSKHSAKLSATQLCCQEAIQHAIRNFQAMVMAECSLIKKNPMQGDSVGRVNKNNQRLEYLYK